jgi:hypothetical protein
MMAMLVRFSVFYASPGYLIHVQVTLIIDQTIDTIVTSSSPLAVLIGRGKNDTDLHREPEAGRAWLATGHCIMPVRCGHWLFAVQAGGTQAQRHRPRRSGGAAPYMA